MAGLAGAAAVPLAARAQQTAVPVVGVLSPQSPGPFTAKRVAGFLRGLSELQYVAGENVAIEYRWAEGQFDRLPALAAELVDRRVSVLVAAGGSTGVAKAATATIPIVGMSGGDPVRAGFVASLNRPGGNVTGIALFASSLGAKRLELLREAVPAAKLIGLLVNSVYPDPEAKLELAEVEAAARSVGVQISVVAANNDKEFEEAFATMSRQGAGALLVLSSPLLVARRAQLTALAARYAIPAIYESRDTAVIGGLMSYGIDFLDAYRQLGIYTAKILKGAKPADLPMQQLVKIELVINLKTAKALGVTFPLTLLGRADEVIE
jgi:putative ABC transport system substrate-binding protein